MRKVMPEELDILISIDEASSELYEAAGIELELDHDHPFVMAESLRWSAAINKGCAYLALDQNNTPIGFITFGMVDDNPYLDQLSVHPDFMRQGVGGRLLGMAISWSGDRSLWLTTYAHVSWNRPYYQRHGFVEVPEASCGPELRGILKEQRSVLPSPEYRIAMVRDAR